MANIETVEGRWDVLYRDYPEVYAAFVSFPYKPTDIEVITTRFDLSGKRLVDIGPGSGEMSRELARHARHVIGIEPETAMLSLARQSSAGLSNLEFLQGSRESIPLPDESADILTSFTAGLDVAEALRVVRPGGLLIHQDVAPGWYGGDLNAIIGAQPDHLEKESEYLTTAHGFSSFDYETTQEYGSMDNIVRTYGFIHGKGAIEYLRATGRTSIRWRFRVHYRYKTE